MRDINVNRGIEGRGDVGTHNQNKTLTIDTAKTSGRGSRAPDVKVFDGKDGNIETRQKFENNTINQINNSMRENSNGRVGGDRDINPEIGYQTETIEQEKRSSRTAKKGTLVEKVRNARIGQIFNDTNQQLHKNSPFQTG